MAEQRFCGANPQVFELLRSGLAAGGVPAPGSSALAAEVMSHGGQVPADPAAFQQAYAYFLQQGFDDAAAQQLAVEALETRGTGGLEQETLLEP